MNFMTIIKLVITLLPLLKAAVDAAEDAFPQPGMGSHKLEMVRHALETAIEFSNSQAGTFSIVWPILQSMIATIVKAKKALTGDEPKTQNVTPVIS